VCVYWLPGFLWAILVGTVLTGDCTCWTSARLLLFYLQEHRQGIGGIQTRLMAPPEWLLTGNPAR
jgi:hypothetical protein